MLEEIINFWFVETPPKNWFVKDTDFDQLITDRFSKLHAEANANELFAWRDTPPGCLAEIIILDQFSRNIYRDNPQAFASDPLALCIAQYAVAAGFDKQLPVEQRSFIYMPYMHSESLLIHDIAVELFSQPGMENNLDFEIQHQNIIKRLGRYPHRNKILGRKSSPEEEEFLTQPGSGF